MESGQGHLANENVHTIVMCAIRLVIVKKAHARAYALDTLGVVHEDGVPLRSGCALTSYGLFLQYLFC